MGVIYEWVAERLDADGDIIECSYWSEGEGAKAFETFEGYVTEAEASAGGADFGLCRREGDEVDGDTNRNYAYVEADFLGGFDCDRPVPKRLRDEFAGFWRAA